MKRGLAAPLLFLALALGGKGSFDASPMFWAGALACLWASALVMPSGAEVRATALGACVAALALWIAGTNLFANPSYTAAALYEAAFLFGGYLYGRRVGAAPRAVYATALTFGIAIAAWALWQQNAAGEERAHGPFITPATLAAVTNLILAPGLVLVLGGSRRPTLVAALVVLAIVLAASASRGGWIGLAASIAVALVLLRRARIPVSLRSGVAAAGILALGAAGGWLWYQLVGSLMLGELTGAQAGASFRQRLELYQLAIAGIQPSTWLFGAGYDAFYYLLETGRGAVPSYIGATTYFVHNDYLQALFELGVPGLAGLLLIVVVPLADSWRSVPRLEPAGQRTLIAGAAAIVAMAVHALGDFPFFIPLCILMYGIALGLFDATRVAAMREENPMLQRLTVPPMVKKGLVAAVATLVVWILAVPVAAEAAAEYAKSRWDNADARGAAFWFEAARRIDARDWRYHWYAGQFWAIQAESRSDPAAARLADADIAAAVKANPRDARPLYSRVVLHIRLRRVLPAPAGPATLRAWVDQAVALAPTDRGLLVERARIYRQFPLEGRK